MSWISPRESDEHGRRATVSSVEQIQHDPWRRSALHGWWCCCVWSQRATFQVMSTGLKQLINCFLRIETRYRIKQLPKWCWFPGPWNLYPPFRGFVKTTATQLIGQLNAKVDQVKFEFLLEKLNKTWSTMKKIMVAFLCAMASKGTNVRMTVR